MVEEEAVVHLESSGPVEDVSIPKAWSTAFVENIEKTRLIPPTKSNDEPSLVDIGLVMVKGTLDRIEILKNNKSKKKSSDSSSEAAKPTSIQLSLWPALLKSFEAASPWNVVGIAPTGTGKTQAYVVPILSHCVQSLIRRKQSPAQSNLPSSHSSGHVHGLVLVPTRELAIQVSKEFKMAAKVANRFLFQWAGGDAPDQMDRDKTVIKVEAIAVYGGVDVDSQISQMGFSSETRERKGSPGHALVVAATPGRLLDLLKRSIDRRTSTSPFASLQVVVFDEADRIAVNADMAGQVDEILTILRNQRVISDSCQNKGDDNIRTCLVSATLPQRAKEVCERWVPSPRLVVKIDPVKVGGEEQPADIKADKQPQECSKIDEPPETSKDHGAKKKGSENLDFGSIPSHLVQTLHVCSNHKKPKKLIATLQRIYSKPKDSQNGRYHNQLCIVFFAQIKNVKYAAKLLKKEGEFCLTFEISHFKFFTRSLTCTWHFNPRMEGC